MGDENRLREAGGASNAKLERPSESVGAGAGAASPAPAAALSHPLAAPPPLLHDASPAAAGRVGRKNLLLSAATRAGQAPLGRDAGGRCAGEKASGEGSVGRAADGETFFGGLKAFIAPAVLWMGCR